MRFSSGVGGNALTAGWGRTNNTTSTVLRQKVQGTGTINKYSVHTAINAQCTRFHTHTQREEGKRRGERRGERRERRERRQRERRLNGHDRSSTNKNKNNSKLNHQQKGFSSGVGGQRHDSRMGPWPVPGRCPERTQWSVSYASCRMMPSQASCSTFIGQLRHPPRRIHRTRRRVQRRCAWCPCSWCWCWCWNLAI